MRVCTGLQVMGGGVKLGDVGMFSFSAACVGGMRRLSAGCKTIY